MANFTYSARDKAGIIRKGTVFADDRAAAAAALSTRGLTPILVKEQVADNTKTGGILGKFKLGGGVKLEDKVIFSRQFATMINAGVPIAQSLHILEEQSTSKNFQAAISQIRKQVEGGGTLANALAAHPDIFNDIYVNMVKAGEAGGILDNVLDRLATQQEKDAAIVGKIRGAMIYPAVISVATVAAFFFLMTVIVPKLAVVFQSSNVPLPWYTQLMLGISGFLTHHGIFVILGVTALVVVFTRWHATPAGKYAVDKLILKLPIFGPIIIKVNVARFARTFGSLMASGISVLEALGATRTALGNSVYRKELVGVAQQVKNGKLMSEQLKGSKNFPGIVSQMIAVGEETGKLDEILLKLAEFYETEVDSVIAGITSIIEPILIIVLGGMVGFVVISVFGPIAALSNTV